jgi:formate dehydrogenase subunit gamma
VKDRIQRHDAGTRIAHWTVALLYVALSLSGLALFDPHFYWLSSLFGGGPPARILHPFLGAALFLLFSGYAVFIWRDNLLLRSDLVWIRRALEIMQKRADVPVEGKYNAGQKLLFWVMLLVTIGLFASGLFMWRPYFAERFSAETRRIATVAHVVFAFAMFAAIGVHAYAAFWTKGSIMAMTRGTVSRAWAKFHHPGWYRKVTGEAAGETGK